MSQLKCNVIAQCLKRIAIGEKMDHMRQSAVLKIIDKDWWKAKIDVEKGNDGCLVELEADCTHHELFSVGQKLLSLNGIQRKRIKLVSKESCENSLDLIDFDW